MIYKATLLKLFSFGNKLSLKCTGWATQLHIQFWINEMISKLIRDFNRAIQRYVSLFDAFHLFWSEVFAYVRQMPIYYICMMWRGIEWCHVNNGLCQHRVREISTYNIRSIPLCSSAVRNCKQHSNSFLINWFYFIPFYCLIYWLLRKNGLKLGRHVVYKNNWQWQPKLWLQFFFVSASFLKTTRSRCMVLLL